MFALEASLLWGYDILELASTVQVRTVYFIHFRPPILHRLGYLLVGDSDRSHCKSLNTFDQGERGVNRSTATESLRSYAVAQAKAYEGRWAVVERFGRSINGGYNSRYKC